MSYIFRYTVTYYNEIDCVNESKSGFVVANSTTEATSKIINEYGEDNTLMFTLCFFSEGELIEDEAPGINSDTIESHLSHLTTAQERYTFVVTRNTIKN